MILDPYRADIPLQQTEDVAESLKRSGIMAFHYHAGMQTENRGDIQDKFMREQNAVVMLPEQML